LVRGGNPQQIPFVGSPGSPAGDDEISLTDLAFNDHLQIGKRPAKGGDKLLEIPYRFHTWVGGVMQNVGGTVQVGDSREIALIPNQIHRLPYEDFILFNAHTTSSWLSVESLPVHQLLSEIGHAMALLDLQRRYLGRIPCARGGF